MARQAARDRRRAFEGAGIESTVAQEVLAPTKEWRLYRAWGELPSDAPVWQHVVDFLLGPQLWLLYIGITGRTMLDRASDHHAGNRRFAAPPKKWAPDVVRWERDPRRFRTLKDAEDAETEAIRREKPKHNIRDAGTDPNRATRRRRCPPTKLAVWRAKLGAALGLWLLLAYIPVKVATGHWPQWGTETWWCLGLAAAVMVSTRLVLASRSPVGR